MRSVSYMCRIHAIVDMVRFSFRWYYCGSSGLFIPVNTYKRKLDQFNRCITLYLFSLCEEHGLTWGVSLHIEISHVVKLNATFNYYTIA